MAGFGESHLICSVFAYILTLNSTVFREYQETHWSVPRQLTLRSTYQACVRRNGIYSGGTKKPANWNAELGEELKLVLLKPAELLEKETDMVQKDLLTDMQKDWTDLSNLALGKLHPSQFEFDPIANT